MESETSITYIYIPTYIHTTITMTTTKFRVSYDKEDQYIMENNRKE